VRRLVVLGVIVTALASFYFAAAATLGGISASDVAADGAAIAACDSGGFTETYTTSGGDVTAINLGGIADPACEGGKLSVTLTNSVGDSIASGGAETIATDGDSVDNSVTVAVSPNPAAEEVSGYHVAIVGP
jgi:hypothetical protein